VTDTRPILNFINFGLEPLKRRPCRTSKIRLTIAAKLIATASAR
jgi:hypothetical protein